VRGGDAHESRCAEAASAAAACRRRACGRARASGGRSRRPGAGVVLSGSADSERPTRRKRPRSSRWRCSTRNSVLHPRTLKRDARRCTRLLHPPWWAPHSHARTCKPAHVRAPARPHTGAGGRSHPHPSSVGLCTRALRRARARVHRRTAVKSAHCAAADIHIHTYIYIYTYI
jgi:hypothetical protein